MPMWTAVATVRWMAPKARHSRYATLSVRIGDRHATTVCGAQWLAPRTAWL